jgi:predicted transcriptional regulator
VNLQILAPFDPRSENHDKQLAHWIGDLLLSLRKRRGICQSQLSKMAAGIDRSYLSKAENGLVLLPLSKLLPLAQALAYRAKACRLCE